MSKHLIFGILWLFVGLATILYLNPWPGVAMILLGIFYMVYAGRRSR